MPSIDWGELGWKLVGALAPIILSALAVYVIRFIRSKSLEAKAQHHHTIFTLLDAVASQAVLAAEQTQKNNPERLQYAVQFVESYLTRVGLPLPVGEILAAVEASVLTETEHSEPAA